MPEAVASPNACLPRPDGRQHSVQLVGLFG